MTKYADLSQPALQPVEGQPGVYLGAGTLAGLKRLQNAAGDEEEKDTDATDEILLILFQEFLCDENGVPIEDMQTLESMDHVRAPVRLINTASAMIKGQRDEGGGEGN